MRLVDTNILIHVLNNEPRWSDWSINQLRLQSKIHVLSINPIIYLELSCAFSKIEDLDDVVHNMGLKYLQMPSPALFLAAKAFLTYRQKKGGPSTIFWPIFL